MITATQYNTSHEIGIIITIVVTKNCYLGTTESSAHFPAVMKVLSSVLEYWRQRHCPAL